MHLALFEKQINIFEVEENPILYEASEPVLLAENKELELEEEPKN